MTPRENDHPQPSRQGVSTLKVAMLLGSLALVGMLLAGQRQIDRLDRQVNARLDSLETRLQEVPSNPSAETADRSTTATPTPNPLLTAADANPILSALVGVRPVGSKMPDANRVYEFDLSGRPAKGSADAPVTIVEFSDFECSFCRKSLPTLARIQEVYGDQVRLVWKHLPLSIHTNAPQAHIASVAAANQGKFWEYRDLLFANPGKLAPEHLAQYAFDLGLRMQQFEEDRQDPETRKIIEVDMAEAVAIDLTAPPGFFVNGRYIRGAKPFEDFAAVINDELTRRGLPVPEAALIQPEPPSS